MTRTWIYRIGVVVLALAWYGITAIESYTMGLHPLARRNFTTLDIVLFVVVIGGAFGLRFWSRR